jgi:hypothetical protein
VHQHDPVAVSVGEVAAGGGGDDLGEPQAGLLRIGRRAQRRQRGGPARQVGQLPEPIADAALLPRDHRRVFENGRGPARAARRGEVRNGLPAGGPIGQCLRQLLEAPGGGALLAQGAHGMAHPDHAVGGPCGDAGHQARPPGGQHLGPVRLGELPAEPLWPVAHPAVVAERLAPVVAIDRVEPARLVVQQRLVHVEPVVDRVGAAMPRKGFHRHRAVVGEPPVRALGPESVQSFVRLVQNFVHGPQYSLYSI